MCNQWLSELLSLVGRFILLKKVFLFWSDCVKKEFNYAELMWKLENFLHTSWFKCVQKHTAEEYPFRGPCVYQNGDFNYHNIINGKVEWYQGYEEIFLLNNKVYECYYHGGSIKW